MTREEALLIEQEFLNDFVGNHKFFSLSKNKGKYWYLNLAKKHNLKLENNNISLEQLYRKKQKKKFLSMNPLYNKEYYAKNKEKINEQRKIFAQKNPEIKKQWARKAYLNNREHYIENAKKYKEKNRFKIKIYKRINGMKTRFRKRMGVK